MFTRILYSQKVCSDKARDFINQTTDVKGGITDINWLDWGMVHFYSHEIMSIPRDTDALRLLLSNHFRMSAPNFDYLKNFDLNKLRDIDQGNGIKFIWACYEDDP